MNFIQNRRRNSNAVAPNISSTAAGNLTMVCTVIEKHEFRHCVQPLTFRELTFFYFKIVVPAVLN